MHISLTDLKVYEAMGHDFGSVKPNVSVSFVAELINQNHWGEVIVVDEEGSLKGIITKEHIMKIITNGFPLQTPISEICNTNVIATGINEKLVVARDIMRRHNIGRLPVMDDEGRVVGMITARDVCNGFSGRLEMLGEHMYAVMENIVEAVQIINCEGIVVFWNHEAEKIFGVRAEDVVGLKLETFFPDDLLLKVITTRESYSNILSELKEGLFVIRNAVPVVVPDGQIVGGVCTTQNISQYRILLDKLEEAHKQVRNLEQTRDAKKEERDKNFYSVNKRTRKVLSQAKKVAKTDATVLIQGESGTGKDVLATILHQNSHRASYPFIKVNCSAIPETLFESEMFGYEAGAFTGAQKYGKKGKFELAKGGTIFLDEIGELPLGMQAKLLRVLEEKCFYRVGGTNIIASDVRIIAATNKKLCKLVEEDKFRQDLYYRLNVICLEIPPLRERKDDIVELTTRFLKKLSCAYGSLIEGIDDEVLGLFINYSWPGNVRQLYNLLERIVILTDRTIINRKSLEEAGVMETFYSDSTTETKSTEEVGIVPLVSTSATVKLGSIVASHERYAITNALQRCNNNKAKAAKLLGIPRSTLYYKLKTLGIEQR